MGVGVGVAVGTGVGVVVGVEVSVARAQEVGVGVDVNEAEDVDVLAALEAPGGEDDGVRAELDVCVDFSGENAGSAEASVRAIKTSPAIPASRSRVGSNDERRDMFSPNDRCSDELRCVYPFPSPQSPKNAQHAQGAGQELDPSTRFLPAPTDYDGVGQSSGCGMTQMKRNGPFPVFR